MADKPNCNCHGESTLTHIPPVHKPRKARSQCGDIKEKCCVIAFAPKVVFLSAPVNKSFNQTNGEVTLFETIVPLTGTKQVMIDTALFGELITSDDQVTVTYRLYINGRQAAQGGDNGGTAVSSPFLLPVTIPFGSNMGSTTTTNITVRVTGRITGGTGSTTPAVNFDNTIQSFRGSKGAFLRILVF